MAKKKLQLHLPLNDCRMIVRADGSLSTHGGTEHGPMIILFTRDCDASAWINKNLVGAKGAPFRIVRVEVREAVQ